MKKTITNLVIMSISLVAIPTAEASVKTAVKKVGHVIAWPFHKHAKKVKK